MSLEQKHQASPQPTDTRDGPQERTNVESAEASAGGFAEHNAITSRLAALAADASPAIRAALSRDVGAPELAEQYEHSAPLPFPKAINDQIARSYGQGVTDGMRAGMLNTAERMERELEDLRRIDARDIGGTHRAGEIAALERWSARIRAAVTL